MPDPDRMPFDAANSEVSRCIWCGGPFSSVVFVEQHVTCSKGCRDRARELEDHLLGISRLVSVAVSIISASAPAAVSRTSWSWNREGVALLLAEDETGDRSIRVVMSADQKQIAALVNRDSDVSYQCPDEALLADTAGWFGILTDKGPAWRLRKKVLLEWLIQGGDTPVSPLLPSSDE